MSREFRVKESYGTDYDSFGVKSRNMENAVEYLAKVSKRLNNVVIENVDFERIIKIYDRSKALFYLDPPYYGAEKYYSASFTLEEHIKLKTALEQLKGRFILSYNDCEFIRDLYNEYNITEVERMSNLVKREKKPKFKELLIKNY